MAIVVESERNRIGILAFLTWAAVLAVIVIAVYYIFFKSPEGIVGDTPENFASTQGLADKIDKLFDAESVVSSPEFKGRAEYVTQPTPGASGRENPFLPL